MSSQPELKPKAPKRKPSLNRGCVDELERQLAALEAETRRK
jgi:hypothetical protein